VCTGFNADFDGDQMAVHLPPVDRGADRGARADAVDQQHLLRPPTQTRSISADQDIVLRLLFPDPGQEDQKGEGKVFAGYNDVLMALDRRRHHPAPP